MQWLLDVRVVVLVTIWCAVGDGSPVARCLFAYIYLHFQKEETFKTFVLLHPPCISSYIFLPFYLLGKVLLACKYMYIYIYIYICSTTVLRDSVRKEENQRARGSLADNRKCCAEKKGGKKADSSIIHCLRTLAPIWFPHWPACRWTSSIIVNRLLNRKKKLSWFKTVSDVSRCRQQNSNDWQRLRTFINDATTVVEHNWLV